MNRTEWLKRHPDPDKRRKMSMGHPLAYQLEYPVQILFPGRGFQEFQLYDFQQLLLLDEALKRAANKMRQGGLTTAFGYEAWWKLTHIPGTQIVAISKNGEAVENFIFYVSMFDAAYRAVDRRLPPIGKDNKRFISYPDNHSWIKGVASDKRAGTSFTATDLYFDETAHAKYAEEIYQSAMPMIAKTGGTATLFSSPNGRGNLHHRIHTGREKYDFSLHQYEWWWVPEYNEYYDAFWKAHQSGDLSAINAAIAKARTGKWFRDNRQGYTDRQWEEEFECSFDANTANFFSSKALRRTFYGRPLELLHDDRGICTALYHVPPKPGWRYYNGIDLGRKGDATVSWTYGIAPGREQAEVVDYRYMAPKSLTWPLILEELNLVNRIYKPRSRHDSTGAGDVLSSGLEFSEPVLISANQHSSKKLDMLTMLAQAMESEVLQSPRFVGRRGVGDAYGEHEGYQLADRLLKTDTVMANMLAVSCFYQPKSLFIGVDKGYSYV